MAFFKVTLQTLLLVSAAMISYGQHAEELNIRAKELLIKGDMADAIPILQEAADAGSAEAAYNLAICYQQGDGIAQNDSIANLWMLKSAGNGWVDAQYQMSYNYAAGKGIKQDYTQAFHWTEQCALQHDPDCMFNMAICYQRGIGTPENTDSMVSWTIRLALLPNPVDLRLSGKITAARLNLAKMYMNGTNVPRNLERSYMWFLIYNENKRDFSLLVQQQNINLIKEEENQLTPENKSQAISDAEKIFGHPLANLINLHMPDL